MTREATEVEVMLAVASDMLEGLLLELQSRGSVAARETLTVEVARSCAVVAAIVSGDGEPIDRLQLARANIEALRVRLERLGASHAHMLQVAVGVSDTLEGCFEALLRQSHGSQPERKNPGLWRRFTASRGLPTTREGMGVVTPRAVPVDDDDEPVAIPRFDVDELFEEALAHDDRQPAQERLAASVDVPESHLVPLRKPSIGHDITVAGRSGELAQLRRLARDCLEDIGVMGNQRRARPADRWADAFEQYDQRLLAHLDALMALGEPWPGGGSTLDLPAVIADYANQAAVDDPFREFARTIALCCMDGDDKVRAAVVALKQSPPGTYRAQADALSLATNRHVVGAMRRLCRESTDPAILRTALTTLHRRRAGDAVELEVLLRHADTEVRAGAVRCLVVAAPDRAGVAIDRLLAVETEDDVVVVALESLLLVEPQRARAEILQRMQDDRRSPGSVSRRAHRALLRLLGVAGQKQDLEQLLAPVPEWLESARVQALGWFGHPQAVSSLIAALEGTHAKSAALALHRVTGATFGQDDPYLPPTDAAAWAAWVENNPLEGATRYRLGRPFALATAVEELTQLHVPQHVRELLAFELAVAVGTPWVDVQGWIAVQKAHCQQLAERVLDRPIGRWFDFDKKNEA